MNREHLLASIVAVVLGSHALGQITDEAIRELNFTSFDKKLRQQTKDQTWRNLRRLGDAANLRDVQLWREIDTRERWEKLREERLEKLRVALGGFPSQRLPLDVRISGTMMGDGFVVENLVYRTRPDFWVTANLYRPLKPASKMPGILIAHSHHRPKTQGELQDMGMTWARAGCIVLVIDQVGHGERADHPFRSERDYKKKDEAYRWWRQDYYYRFDTNAQLHLVGQSLMGWMVWDLMRGVDLLLSRPGIDSQKIILLGAVAGGGDPAAVTAALDRRIQAAVPFNFGGPQPETRYPLPDDAELRFNYLGGAYWEGTRNLRRTGADGFFAWTIVGSIAPRKLIYAHEFAWDRERDPVWKRLNKLYGFYNASGNIDYTLGRGSVRGNAPEATHCTNIGRHHRQRIHQAFERWFGIRIKPDDEYRKRIDASKLISMTPTLAQQLRPKKLHRVLAERSAKQVKATQEQFKKESNEERHQRLRADWRQWLGDSKPKSQPRVISLQRFEAEGVRAETIGLQVEEDIVLPLVLLSSAAKTKGRRVVIGVAQAGKSAFIQHRRRQIAKLLNAGAVVALLDVRGVGTSRGSRGELGSASYYALLFDTPLLGYRLRDVRATLSYLRSREDLPASFAMWGESFTKPNDSDRDFQVPKRVGGRPRFSEPLGGLLAMLTALFEDDIHAVAVNGGLVSFQDVLNSPFVYIPHDVVVPHVLTRGDLPDLAAALAPRPLSCSGLVDGLNRSVAIEEVRQVYAPALHAYRRNDDRLDFAGQPDMVKWLLR